MFVDQLDQLDHVVQEDVKEKLVIEVNVDIEDHVGLKDHVVQEDAKENKETVDQ
jgi:hypothetical protein